MYLFPCGKPVSYTHLDVYKRQGYISAFIAKKVDGIILASVQSRYSNAYDLFKKYDVPYVLVDRNIRHSHYGAGVFVCNDYALFTACEYLIRHGNTDIAFISGPAMPVSYTHLDVYKRQVHTTSSLVVLINQERRCLYFLYFTTERKSNTKMIGKKRYFIRNTAFNLSLYESGCQVKTL